MLNAIMQPEFLMKKKTKKHFKILCLMPKQVVNKKKLSGYQTNYR